MPAIENWISGTALFLAGSFIFTVIVSIIGIKEMVSDKVLLGLIIVAINLSFLAWYTAARQEEAAGKQAQDNSTMREALASLARQAAPEKPQPDFVENLRASDRFKLREITSLFGQELRNFQNTVEHRRDSLYGAQQSAMKKAKTEDEKNRLWTLHSNASSQESREILTVFQNQYRPRALAIRDELFRRSGKVYAPYADLRSLPLDVGNLAGPHPLNELADYLDELARGLP